jgi:hypothetical protein
LSFLQSEEHAASPLIACSSPHDTQRLTVASANVTRYVRAPEVEHSAQHDDGNGERAYQITSREAASRTRVRAKGSR